MTSPTHKLSVKIWQIFTCVLAAKIKIMEALLACSVTLDLVYDQSANGHAEWKIIKTSGVLSGVWAAIAE